MNDEYTELSLEELVVKALDVRLDAGPLLLEARRRDDVPRSAREKLEELAAVSGKQLSTEWTIVGNVFLSAGDVELGVCIRLKPSHEVSMDRSAPSTEAMG